MTRHQLPAFFAIFSFSAVAACEPGTDLPFDGGQSGEEGIGCTAVDSAELAEDEASVLGFGRSEIALLAEGSHAATLRYADGGSTALTLDLALGAARWLDMEMVSDGSEEVSIEIGCADLVEVDAVLSFSTEDGAFAESWETSLRSPDGAVADLWVDLDLDALSGDYVYTPDAPYEEVVAWVAGTFDSAGNSGEIAGQGIQSEGSGDDGTVSATSLQMASW